MVMSDTLQPKVWSSVVILYTHGTSRHLRAISSVKYKGKALKTGRMKKQSYLVCFHKVKISILQYKAYLYGVVIFYM